MFKLAIVTTHPIQYHSPWFALLSQQEDVALKVFYTWSQRETDFYDKDFGREVKWDIPLLDGYAYEFIPNISHHPNGVSYNGVDCPTLNNNIELWGASHILVIGWNLKAHLKAMRYFKGKIPVWFRGDSTLLDEKIGVKQFLRKKFLTWVYGYIDKAFYVGTRNRAYFKRHGLNDTQLVYAPHAIENSRFLDLDGLYQAEADKIREGLRIKRGEVVVLFCGKFEPKKDPLLLMNLANDSHFPNIHFVFIGGGVLEDEMKRRSNNNPRIHILPFFNQSDMPTAYRIGDIFCLPSKGPGETWGLAINEAMACSKGIVVSDKVGCGIDLVDINFNGFSFRSTQASELDLILEKLTIASCRKLGKNSLIKIKDFTFEKIVEALVAEL